MNKSTTILIIMSLIMLVPVFGASSDNSEQFFAFNTPEQGQITILQNTYDNSTIILIIGLILFFWYIGKGNGG